MKTPYFLILIASVAAGNVYAEAGRLSPPVLDDSTYNEPAAPAAQQPLPNYDSSNNLDKLKSDISNLKDKLQDQEDTIYHLKRANADLQKKLTDLTKNPESAAKASTLDSTLAKHDSEKEQYQHASDLLKKGDYAQAISAFQGVIKAYPTGKYADNSQYWIGVALLNKGDKKAAIQAFDRVARAYPKSEKIPDALFKLGDTLLSVKNPAKAKEYFDYVIENYPGTNGATLAAKRKASAKL